MSRRDSMHDATRDYIENRAGGDRVSFETVDKIDSVHVTEDDDLQTVIDTNGGKTKYILGPGVYRGNFTAPYSDIVIESEYPNEATIELGSDTSTHALNIEGSQSSLLENVAIRGVTFDGRFDEVGGSNAASDATVQIRYAKNVLVERCKFDQTRLRGLSVMSTVGDVNESVWVLNNHFGVNDLNPMYVSANGAVIWGNIMDTGADTGIDCNQGQDYTISNNIYKGDRGTEDGTFIGLFDVTGHIAVTENVGYAIGGAGINCRRANASDEEKITIGDNTFISEDGGGSIGVNIEKVSRINVADNYVEGFSNGTIRVRGGDNIKISDNVVFEPEAHVVYVSAEDGDVSGLTISNNHFDCVDPNGNEQRAVQIDNTSNTVEDVLVASNHLIDPGRCVNGDGVSDIEILDNVAEDGLGGVGISNATNCRVRGNDFEDISSNNGVKFGTGSDNNIIEGNVLPNAFSISVTGSNTVYRDNEGYPTEATGTATFSGDATTTEFNVGTHGLANGPGNESNDQTNFDVTVTPVSSDAKSAAPVTGYPVDPGGDGTFEDIEITFASAPADSTDNVTVRWSARLSGVRGR